MEEKGKLSKFVDNSKKTLAVAGTVAALAIGTSQCREKKSTVKDGFTIEHTKENDAQQNIQNNEQQKVENDNVQSKPDPYPYKSAPNTYERQLERQIRYENEII